MNRFFDSLVGAGIKGVFDAISCRHPKLPNIEDGPDDFLYDKGLGMGTLIVGRQGSGKTAYVAGHRLEYDLRHPSDASWSLDKSGDFTNKYLQAMIMRPEWPELRKRIRYVRLGDPRYAVPLPMFSPLYGNSYEEQVQRVKEVFKKLAGDAIRLNPTLFGVMYEGIFPHVLRLATAMAYTRSTREPFQITEIRAMIESPGLMRRAFNKCENILDESTKDALDRHFLNQERRESEMRSYSLLPIFSDVGAQAGIAHLGADRPTIIPAEVNRKGLIVLVDGSLMTGQKSLLDILMSHIYSLVMEDINARIPHHYSSRVALIIDEARAFLKIPAMAEDIGEISQLYRSRGIQFYLMMQNPRGQLEENLWKNIWSMGNMVCFGLLDKQDCLDVGLQLTRYNPQMIKQPALTVTQNPTTEPLHGQDREVADWVSGFNRREMVMRRYYDEAKPDPYIRHIKQTHNIPMMEDLTKLEEVKDELLRETAQYLTPNHVLGIVKSRVDDLKPAPPAPKDVNT